MTCIIMCRWDYFFKTWCLDSFRLNLYLYDVNNLYSFIITSLMVFLKFVLNIFFFSQVPIDAEVAKHASLYHQVALVLLPWLLPGSEYLAHELLSTVIFSKEFISWVYFFILRGSFGVWCQHHHQLMSLRCDSDFFIHHISDIPYK